MKVLYLRAIDREFGVLAVDVDVSPEKHKGCEFTCVSLLALLVQKYTY